MGMDFEIIDNTLFKENNGEIKARHLVIENDYYRISFVYIGDYAEDKRNGCIDTNNVVMTSKFKKGYEVEMKYSCSEGKTYIGLAPMMPLMTVNEAIAVSEELKIAVECVDRIDVFINEYFRN